MQCISSKKGYALSSAENPNDSLTPTCKPSQPPRSIRKRFWNSWCPEIVAVVFSSACIGAVAVMLRVFSGKPAPSMRFGLTINTVISILGTSAKTSLLFAISNSIGQLKWVWYTGHPRPLLSAEKFDDASRGPLGALTFLLSHTRSSIASIGAFVTICSLAFDPFMQQVIVTRLDVIYQPSKDATLHPSYRFNDLRVLELSDYRSPVLEKAITSALSGGDSAWPYECSTGYCKWPSFQTLAWHTECNAPNAKWNPSPGCDILFVDTNQTVAPGVLNLNCSLSSTAGYSVGNDVPVSVNVTRLNDTTPDSVTVHGVGAQIMTNIVEGVDMKSDIGEDGFIKIPSPVSPTWTALRVDLPYDLLGKIKLEVSACEFKLYVDEYDVTYGPAGLNAILLKSKPLQRAGPQESICLQPQTSPSSSNTTTLGTLANTTQDFVFCSPGLQMILRSFKQMLDLDNKGSYSYPWNNTSSLTGLFQLPTLKSRIENAILESDFEDIMHKLAASLTQLGLDPTLASKDANTTVPFHGQTGSPVNMIEVRWSWLILPYSICLIGAGFLISTVHLTRRAPAPLWKSSIHALLYHGLSSNTDTHSSLMKISEMEEQAATTSARLSSVGPHDRLMLEPIELKTYGP